MTLLDEIYKISFNEEQLSSSDGVCMGLLSGFGILDDLFFKYVGHEAIASGHLFSLQ